MEVRRHEGLEVYTDSASSAPEVSYHGSKDPTTNYVQAVEPKRGPFGLSIWSLCTLVAVVTAVIVGGAVGGGLGAALAECKSSTPNEAISSQLPAEASVCPTTTTDTKPEETAKSEFYKPEAPDQVANLTLPDACSEKDGKDDYTTNNGYVFTYTCGWDYPGNDIAPIIAYTAFDCMYACAMYTEAHKGEENATLCDSIAFVQDMSTAMKQHGANCWLKKGTRDLFPESDRLPRFLYAKRESQ